MIRQPRLPGAPRLLLSKCQNCSRPAAHERPQILREISFWSFDRPVIAPSNQIPRWYQPVVAMMPGSQALRLSLSHSPATPGEDPSSRTNENDIFMKQAEPETRRVLSKIDPSKIRTPSERAKVSGHLAPDILIDDDGLEKTRNLLKRCKRELDLAKNARWTAPEALSAAHAAFESACRLIKETHKARRSVVRTPLGEALCRSAIVLKLAANQTISVAEKDYHLATRVAVVDSAAALDVCLTDIAASPVLYIDIEGENLSRTGTLDVLTVLPSKSQTVYVIAVHKLGDAAFAQASSEETNGTQDGHSLRHILESDAWAKRLWDVRSDAEALFWQKGIKLRNVIDLQLLEVASRSPEDVRLTPERLYGLKRAVGHHAPIPRHELVTWNLIKRRGEALYKPGYGGIATYWRTPSLSTDALRYCAYDVRYLPLLEAMYMDRVENQHADELLEIVSKASTLRVADSEGERPAKGRKDLSPWVSGQLTFTYKPVRPGGFPRKADKVSGCRKVPEVGDKGSDG